jgi:alcohol dehydrogenase class IV
MLQANFANKIVYGENSLEFLEKVEMSRVVVFADRVFCEYNKNVLELMNSIFEKRNVKHWLFYDEGKEPTLGFVKENSKKLIETQPDLIIAIGGGAVMDSVKVMEVYYEHPDITDEALMNRFNLPPVQRKARLLYIPTTSGTGSEVSPIAVIYVPTGNPQVPQVKKGIADYQLIPHYVVLDPRFTVTVPFKITGATGLDAFAHCIEAYVNKNPKNSFTDLFALEGMKRIVANLPIVLKEPGNLQARAQMQIAATMGGIALAGRGSGASHGSGKQLATLVHMPHGTSVAPPMEQVIRLNSRKCLKEYAEIARYLGVEAATDEEAVEGLIKEWNKLMEVTKTPKTISELGISQDKFKASLETIVKNAQNDPAMKGNPVLLTADEIRQIYLNLNK